MDWDYSIERNRLPLLTAVVGLFAMIGLAEGGTVARLPWPVYRFVLRILRPAEAAVRRLIVVMARDIVVEPRAKRPARQACKNSGERKSNARVKDESQRKRKGSVLFGLFDPPVRFEFGYGPRHAGSNVPFRISVLGDEPDTRHPFLRGLRQPPPQPAAASPSAPKPKKKCDTVNAIYLCRRLFAILDALKDLPRQAMRYALWRAQPPEERRPRRAIPLRVGRPPGFRLKPLHEVDEILKECHWLFRSLPRADTS